MQSSFQHLLDSNQPPSPQEVQAIRNLLTQPKRDLEELDKRIASLYSSLKQLISERKSLREYVRFHSLLILPLRQLPPELLSQIFVFSLPSSSRHIQGRALYLPTKGPLAFTEVCRRWRDIALSTPELWSSIEIIFPRTCRQEIFPIDTFCQGIHDWLRHSKTLPLSVSIRPAFPGRPVRNDSVGIARRVVETVVAFSRRWSWIEITASRQALAALNGLGEGDTPLLRHLAYTDPGDDGRNQLDSESSIRHFHSTNQLVSLSLRLCSLQRWLPVVPWPNLRELVMIDTLSQAQPSLSPSLALATLRQCPRLQTCHLALGIPSRPVIGTRLELEHLEELRVAVINPNVDMIPFFDGLILPNLRTLEVQQCDSAQPVLPSDRIACTSMIRRSACPLDTLALLLRPVTDTAVVACLRHVPNLRCLIIGDRFPLPLALDGGTTSNILHESVIQSLTIQPDSSPVLCPRLDTIHVTHCIYTGDLLPRLLKSRRQNLPSGITRLEYALVSFPGQIPHGLEQQLLAMQEEWPQLGFTSFASSYRNLPWLDTHPII